MLLLQTCKIKAERTQILASHAALPRLAALNISEDDFQLAKWNISLKMFIEPKWRKFVQFNHSTDLWDRTGSQFSNLGRDDCSECYELTWDPRWLIRFQFLIWRFKLPLYFLEWVWACLVTKGYVSTWLSGRLPIHWSVVLIVYSWAVMKKALRVGKRETRN